MYNGVHVGARGGTLCVVFHTKQLVFTTLDKVCQPCETSMDDGVNPFRLCWAGRHQQRLIVQPYTVHCLSSFLSTGGIHEMFFCVANMTEWYRMFVKQVMWVPSTSSTSFLKLLRPLFSWLVYFLFSFFATHSASAIWCVSQNGRFHGWHGSESHGCPQSMVLCNVTLGWMWDIFPLDICQKGILRLIFQIRNELPRCLWFSSPGGDPCFCDIFGVYFRYLLISATLSFVGGAMGMLAIFGCFHVCNLNWPEDFRHQKSSMFAEWLSIVYKLWSVACFFLSGCPDPRKVRWSEAVHGRNVMNMWIVLHKRCISIQSQEWCPRLWSLMWSLGSLIIYAGCIHFLGAWYIYIYVCSIRTI